MPWRSPYCLRYYPLTFMLTCQLSISVIIKEIYVVFIPLRGIWGLAPRRRIVSIELRSCSSVDLSTCLIGLTGQEVNILYQGSIGKSEINIGVQGIIGTSYLFTCRPVNLSTRVDRSRGKYRSAGHYGYFVLVHLSTCQPVYQGGHVQM